MRWCIRYMAPKNVVNDALCVAFDDINQAYQAFTSYRDFESEHYGGWVRYHVEEYQP